MNDIIIAGALLSVQRLISMWVKECENSGPPNYEIILNIDQLNYILDGYGPEFLLAKEVIENE